MKKRRYKNIKPQNRLRLVFWEKDGRPLSYIHIEKTEAETFLKVFREISKHPGWVWIRDLGKMLDIPRVSLTWAVIRMSGARYIDVLRGGTYHRLMTGPLILVRKERIHGNVRRGIEKPYMTPPIYVKSTRK